MSLRPEPSARVRPTIKMRALIAQLLRGWSPERSDPRLMGLGIRSGPSVVAAGVGLRYAPCIPGLLRGMRHASSLRRSPRAFFLDSIYRTRQYTTRPYERKTITAEKQLLYVCMFVMKSAGSRPILRSGWWERPGDFSKHVKRSKQQTKLVKPNHGVLSPR